MKTKAVVLAFVLLFLHHASKSQGWLANNTSWTQNNSTYRSNAIANYEATMILDGVAPCYSSGCRWCSTTATGWVIFDFGTTKSLTQFRIFNDYQAYQQPKDCEFQYSSSISGPWTTVSSYQCLLSTIPSGQDNCPGGCMTWEYFPPFSAVSARYWRLQINSSWGSRFQISEVGFLENCALLTPPTAGNNGPICQGTTLLLTATTVSGATYSWTGPNGFSSSLQNPTVSSSATPIMSGVYSVNISKNGCTSSSSTTTVTVNPLPVAAGTITGATTVCQGQNSVVYTVPVITNAMSYTWTLPTGATGTSTTNSITVNYGTSAVSGNITVKGNNTCGSGTISTRAITVNPLPVAAGTITGSATVCQGQSSVTYTVPAITNATSYTWTLPTGATGTSTTNSITVNYGTSAVSGNITVKGNNTCGSGTVSSLPIIIMNITTSNITETVCDSYTAPDGIVYTTSGIKTAVIPNAAGCDSTITINLTVKQTTTSSITETVCDSYTAPDGQVYTTSGIKTTVIPNAAGCDSTITINLTVKNSTTSSITETVCDSYTAPDGIVYTTSGIKTAVIPNAVGCDSTITINLTILNSTSSIETITACTNYTWSATGLTYTTGGTYNTTLTNNAGCDSLTTLNLTINTVTISLQPSDQTVLLGDNAQFTVSTTSPSPTYQWQTDLGVGFQNMTNSGQYSGVTTNTLTVSNTAMMNNNQQFRCIVTSATCSDTTSAASLTVIDDTGIDDGLTSEITIYPNPFSNELIIESINNSETISFEILNSVGQKVFIGNVTDKTIVPTTDFAPGIYVLRLGNGKEFEFRKIVKE